MERRTFLKTLAALSVCPLCAGRGFAAEGMHWSYEGATGPEKWGALSPESAVCSAGSQQSPINITTTTKADLPPIALAWQAQGGTVINNGHTIQINVPGGSLLTTGPDTYELVQYHFHAPSEHLVDGKNFAMEAHFVHKNTKGSGFGVLGVFMEAGEPNAAFAKIVEIMPKQAAAEVTVNAIDPTGFLPKSLAYWRYEGSLTTPPCNEVVDWMVCVDAIQASRADIDRFTALYPMNARPAQSISRRFVLRSS